jgi:sulfite exporter TauE/SafE
MNADAVALPLIFLSGVLGSTHCIGMCGGIAATMGMGATNYRTAVLRQLVWSLGRTMTYSFLGVIAAALGARLLRSGGFAVWVQAAFAVLAGLLLIVQGLSSGGWFSFRSYRKSTHPCLSRTLLSQFLLNGSSTGVFIAGLATGFLPCGLVYSFLALSASSASVLQGLLIMSCFAAGTIPVMLLTGIGFSMATMNVRQQLMKLAAVSVIVTGLMTLSRGIVFAEQQWSTMNGVSSRSEGAPSHVSFREMFSEFCGHSFWEESPKKDLSEVDAPRR